MPALFAACGDHSDLYAIGGTVSGLDAGESVSLLLNGASPLSVSMNGAFTFLGGVHYLGIYDVTVASSPKGKSCSVTGGKGGSVIGPVANVQVQCGVPGYTVGGSLSGLGAGTSVVLQNNGGDPLTLNADGTFTFSHKVPQDGAYSITVATQPAGQTCTVSNYAAAGVTASVSNVSVVCAVDSFKVSGRVSGLGVSESITLQNNGGDPTTVNADGAFAFAVPVAFDGSYAVTIAAQPAGRICTVSNGSGAGVTGNITNVAVGCLPPTHTVSGVLSGLGSGVQITLMNNNGDPLTLRANGTFTFATPVAHNSSYAVTVSTQPVGQTCSVQGASGAGVTADVNAVSVLCAVETHTIGVTVSGLASGRQVTLLNSGADPLTVTTDGSVTFAGKVAHGGGYAVTVGTQPVGQTCTVGSGASAGITTDVSDVVVTCSTTNFSIGGKLTGLNPGAQITLQNNGADSNVLVANGPFAFSTQVAFGAGYDVTISNQPEAQACVVGGGSASSTAANVGTVDINCASAYAYVLNKGGQTISQFTLGVGGALLPSGTPVVPTSVGTAANRDSTLAPHPSGRHVYVTNPVPNTVSQFDVQPDGALTPMSPVAQVGTGTAPTAIAVHPSGRYAYVTNSDDNTVGQFSIDASGALLPLSTPVAAGVDPARLVIHPNGKFLYVSNYGNGTISQFGIALDGSLTPLTPNLVPSGGANPTAIAVDSRGQHAYILNFSGGVRQYDIAANGTLSPLAGVPNANAGYLPTGFVFGPTGKYAYVLSASGSITGFSVASNGALVPGASTATCIYGAATLDTTDRYVYVSCSGTNDVLAYQIGAGGMLTQVTGGTAGGAPGFITTIKGY